MSDSPTPPFADSHVHLADAQFGEDLDAVVARARQQGARAIVCIGESPETAGRAADVASRYPGLVWFTSGLHPHQASEWTPAHAQTIRDDVARGAVAIGECGLDYHYDYSPRDQQRAVFRAQLALAAELDRPVIVHTRDAEADTTEMLAEAAASGVPGVLHCFTGSRVLAETALAHGWLLSFSGVVTFKRYEDDDIIRLVPDDRFLVESDAPYLAPVPHRGHRNEPAWVSLTVAKVAAARGDTPARVGALALANTERIFRLSTT